MQYKKYITTRLAKIKRPIPYVEDAEQLDLSYISGVIQNATATLTKALAVLIKLIRYSHHVIY